MGISRYLILKAPLTKPKIHVHKTFSFAVLSFYISVSVRA